MKSLKRILDELPGTPISLELAESLYTRLKRTSPKSVYAKELAIYVMEYYNNQLGKCRNLTVVERITETAALKMKMQTLEKRFNVYIPKL